MMPTNEERCEVAQRIFDTMMKGFDFSAYNIALSIGIDDPSDFDECFNDEHEEAWKRLIDLIEPGKERECKAEIYTATVPKFDHDEEVDMYECSLCGFYLSHVKDEYIPNYCPHCGAKVVEDEE